MAGKSPLITLNNGIAMPALGLGVYQSSQEETAQAVATAISGGYRLIDTAAAYTNESKVGEGISRSGVGRSELFVTTKLWMSDYGYDRTLHAFDRSLRKLGLDHLDLYLLHWPVPTDFEATVASCAGRSSTATRPSRSRCGRSALPRTSTSSTSR
jgi:diketogulonate reductase-like aldo/keto reductase